MSGEFIGALFDTDAFTFSISEPKLDKLLRCVSKTLRLPLLTACRVSKLRGKLIFYCVALDFASVMTPTCRSRRQTIA